MSRAYLTKKQMPWLFWYFAIKHLACMMNMIPGKYCGKLAFPFMLVYGVYPDQRTWLPLFLLYYFHHNKDSNASRSKYQVHTLNGIMIRRSPTFNTILVYNPRNQHYSEPNSYKLDHIVYHHLSTLLSSTTENSLCHYIKMISLPLANHILQVLMSKTQMLTPTSHAWALWWISHLILQYLHTTLFNLTMGLPNLYLLPKCHLSSLNHPPIHLTLATFCLRSYISTLKSLTNMTDNITRGTYQSCKTEYTASATNHTSTRKSKTEVYHYQISHQNGMSYVQKVC